MTKAAVQAAVEKSLQNRQVALHLSNGDALEIPHPDHVSYSPTTPEMIVWPRGPGFAVIALDEIVRVAILPSPRRRAGA